MIPRRFPLLCAVIKASLLFVLPECADALRSLSRSQSLFQFPFSLSLLVFLFFFADIRGFKSFHSCCCSPLVSFCFWVVLKLISSDSKDLSRHHDLLNIASVSVLPPQRTFIFTFLLSSRLFIHPHELMSKVCLLCTEQQRLGDPQADKVRPLLSVCRTTS